MFEMNIRIVFGVQVTRVPLLYPDYSERDFALASGLGLFITALRCYICIQQYTQHNIVALHCAKKSTGCQIHFGPKLRQLLKNMLTSNVTSGHICILYDAGTYTQIFFEQELQKYMYIIEEIQCTYKRLQFLLFISLIQFMQPWD